MDPTTETTEIPSSQEDSAIQLQPEKTLKPNSAGAIAATKIATKSKQIVFRDEYAAHKFVAENIRAVEKAKYFISVAWYLAEDHVYATAADRLKVLEEVTIADSETIDDFNNRLQNLIVAAHQFRTQEQLKLIAYRPRQVAQSMSIAADKWVSRRALDRGRKGTQNCRKVVIKKEGCAKEVEDWNWNDDTEEESWEDLGFVLHHAQISWVEQCYMEDIRLKESTIKRSHGCYRPSLLRWSLTVEKR